MLRRGFGFFSIFAIAQGLTGCLSDHCTVHRDHCAELAQSTDSSTDSSDADETSELPDEIPDLPTPPDLPESAELTEPTLELSVSQIKQFEFSWALVPGASHYRLLERAQPSEAFVQIGTDLSGDAVSLMMPLHFRVNASYKLLACDPHTCTESAVVDVVGHLAEAVGYFKADTVGKDEYFGTSVALSSDGDTLAVGASGDSEISSGAVHVFVRTDVVWSPQAYLEASNADPDDFFGADVALSDDGNTLAVSAPNEDSGATGIDGDQDDEWTGQSGAVYVFVRVGDGWSQQAYVKSSDTEDHDRFGTSLALSADGNTLAVGTREDSDTGAVHVFVRDADTWSPHARLEASNAHDHDRFGSGLALSADGNTLAVGASFEDSGATEIDGDQLDDSASDSGAAYVFIRDADTWTQQTYVKGSNSSAHDLFGASVALSENGDTLAVGAHGESESGAVYVFVRSGGIWSQQAYAQASNPEQDDSFGANLALSDDGAVLAVGARRESSHAIGIDGDQSDNSTSNAGAVYVFVRSENVWSQRAYVKASNTGKDDDFGAGVALSADGDTLAVGARTEAGGLVGIGGDQTDDSVEHAGAVYLY